MRMQSLAMKDSFCAPVSCMFDVVSLLCARTQGPLSWFSLAHSPLPGILKNKCIFSIEVGPCSCALTVYCVQYLPHMHMPPKIFHIPAASMQSLYGGFKQTMGYGRYLRGQVGVPQASFCWCGG